MNYDKILAALETTLMTVPDLPYVAFENVKYDPVVGTPYIRTRFIPIARRNIFLGQTPEGRPYRQRYVGLFQLVLNYPDSEGSAATNATVNNIISVFDATKDISFEDVDLTISYSERMRGINEGPWYKTPVNINWYTYSQ